MSDAVLAPGALQPFLVALFEHAGVSRANAEVVVAHLLDSSACGLPSHGVLRVPEYLDAIDAGRVDAAAAARVVSDGAVLVLDAGRALGQVAAMGAVDATRQRARANGVAVVALRHAAHLGRIGAYVEALARDGLVAIAFCSVPTRFHNVAWSGAREGRIGTNPIAYAYPTSGEPVVADFSTSATPEGRIRLLRNQGKPAPVGLLRDADGRPTTDPNVLYATPGGTLQPLGSPDLGHKGSALGMLVEVFGTLLAGETADDPDRDNNLTLLALLPDDGFVARADAYVDYIHAAVPIDPTRPPLVPGELEANARRACTTITVDATTWAQIAAHAELAGLPVPEVAGKSR
jgi:LDH2 family malate/lactate/ureidoglycolate dehydrogenase